MKWDHHLRSAIKILDDYDGSLPLAIFLKSYFRRHPQMGSRDRKNVSSLLYNYYRLGHAYKPIAADKKFLAALFLCGSSPDELLQYFYPSWNERIGLPLADKIQYLSTVLAPFDAAEIFPWKEELSEGIDHAAFCLSFLRQPSLFIRVRKGKLDKVSTLLRSAGIPFSDCGNSCIALPNGTNADAIIPDKSWYVIQDRSSQQTAGYFILPSAGQQPLCAWDCCAGSGGKAMLFHDLYPQAELWVSDTRGSILHNLRKRFSIAGIRNYHAQVFDLTVGPDKMKGRSFDIILLDAPCTGSGTWGRTPERLYYFDPATIRAFRQRQRQIAINAAAHLKKKASLVYITCSVFKEENELLVSALLQEGLRATASGLLKGYEKEADTMFATTLVPA